MNRLTENQIAFLTFGVTMNEYSAPKSVVLDPLCNSWVVQNIGDIWVTVNGILLKGHPVGHPELTGAAVGVSGNYGEVFKGILNIQSAETTPGSGSTSFLVIVIQKIYAV